MSDLTPPLHDDDLADSAVINLRFRYRAFLAMAWLLAAGVTADLISHGSLWSRVVLTLSGTAAGIGIPWLIWHLRVPFAARVAFPIVGLIGQPLNGQDPRENLSMLAAALVVCFLFGWGIDLCLRQKSKALSFTGRILFSAFWIYIVWFAFAYSTEEAKPERWYDLVLMCLGITAVWLPRECLVPQLYRLNAGTEAIVARGLSFAGGWLTRRVGIAILIILPSFIYLDLLDLPPLLRADIESAKAQSKQENVSGKTEAGPIILFWKREARALTECDFTNEGFEIHQAAAHSTEPVIKAIRELRLNPLSGEALGTFQSLSKDRVTNLADLEKQRGKVPLFYIDHKASGDDRVTAGLLDSPEAGWSKWVELRPLSEKDVARIEIEIRRATIAILANGILILLLLGGPGGGSATAWWLAILLAGTNLGWISESIGLGLDRPLFVIWREYANHQVGAALFAVHTLLVSFVRTAEWLTQTMVAYVGIWVALCSPAAALSSRFRRFWIQFAKIATGSILLVGLLFGLVYGLIPLWEGWRFIWYFLLPLFLVGTGIWWRRRSSPGSNLPVIGKMATVALLLRGWVPLLLVWEMGWTSPQGYDLWIGHLAVLLGLVASLLIIIALERGTFLSPPHVEGQVWLIGIAAIPFLENVVGDPMSRLIEDSDLFLGSTVKWIAFAGAIWVIGPVFSFFGRLLSEWRARGLTQIDEMHHSLHNLARSIRTNDAALPVTLCQDLFSSLDIVQPQLWKHMNGGSFQRLIPASDALVGEKLISRALAETLGAVDSSLRLEEMRLEWKWAAFHDELNRWFTGGGDLLLVPASHEGELLGIFAAADLPENRFLLRPAVSHSLGKALATAILLSPPVIDAEDYQSSPNTARLT